MEWAACGVHRGGHGGSRCTSWECLRMRGLRGDHFLSMRP